MKQSPFSEKRFEVELIIWEILLVVLTTLLNGKGAPLSAICSPLVWCPWKSLTWATFTYCLQISNWQSQTCRRHFREDKAKSRSENAAASQLRPLKGLNDNFSDERRTKTNAVLSDFTSIIHLLNAVGTMRTKVACEVIILVTKVKRLSPKKTKKNAGHLIRAPVLETAARLDSKTGKRCCSQRRKNMFVCFFCLTLVKPTHAHHASTHVSYRCTHTHRNRNIAGQQHLVRAVAREIKSHF